MAKRVYPALVVRDLDEAANSCFGVVFPDLPGCVTCGGSLEHAARMAYEALALHVGSMAGYGDTLPESSSLGAVPDWLDPAETKIVARLLVPVEPPT